MSTPYFSNVVTGAPVNATSRNDFDGGLGFKFTISATLTIKALGRYFKSGNNGTHNVRILNDGGGTVVSSNVDMTGTPEADGFIYNTVSDTVINAGTYYCVSTEVNGGDTWWDPGTGDPPTHFMDKTADATTVNNVFQTGGTGVPTDASAANTSYVPPNFKYTTGGVSGGPAPFFINNRNTGGMLRRHTAGMARA